MIDASDGGALVAVRVPLSAEAVERRRNRPNRQKQKVRFNFTGYPSFPKEQEAENAKTLHILTTY
ncbi:MAG: hypothetical protein IJE97_08420 [Thermoguttaceae bacterium]|nr:hypothetical protein [Thermoguttaceae bacterium]